MPITFSQLGASAWGRLGNSLFQLAATYGLAKEYNTQCFFPNWKYSQYFKGNIPIGSPQKATVVAEPHYHYAPNLLDNINAEVIDLRGWYQSWKYFDRKDILELLEFKGLSDK